MPRHARRRANPPHEPPPSLRSPASTSQHGLWLLSAFVVLLNAPGVALGYFWDDYYFLHMSGPSTWAAQLLPHPGLPFFRPIPLGLYFGLLRLVDPAGGFWGHALNIGVLVATVLLLARLVASLAGARAGLYAGLVFASVAAIPALTAWVSGSQDLFAMFFVVVALRLRHGGRDVPALACAAAGLLCKETAIAAFPVLVLWDRIVGRRPEQRPALQWIGYGAIAFAWAAVHPGIHLLAGRGLQSGATAYVGLEHSERWPLYIGRYLATLVNLPPPGVATPWWPERALYGGAALLLLAAGLLVLERGRALAGKAEPSVSPSRVALLGGLLALPGLLMPSLLVRHWAPYFACLPAVGVATAVGPLLARRKGIAPAALAIFLLLGVGTRGAIGERELVLSERAMVEASDAARTVRANLQRLLPTLPKGCQVVASFGTEGLAGIQSGMIEGQAMSFWYGDPTLTTVTALKRRPGAPADVLVRITRDLDVIVIEGDSLRMRSNAPGPPEFQEYDRLVGNYARAVAAGGDPDRGIALLERLAESEPSEMRPYNRRLIASMLLTAGRRGAADSILATTGSFPGALARQMVWRLQAEATSSERLDETAFEAFGLRADDPGTIRWMMREFRKNRSTPQAAWWARRLDALLPGDSEAAEILTLARRAGIEPAREAPQRLARGAAGG